MKCGVLQKERQLKRSWESTKYSPPEHEDEDEEPYLFHCQQCDKKFKILKDLMMHKKINHVENVNVCWHFLNGFCPYGEMCWFRHETNSNKNKKDLDIKSIKCNICDKALNDIKHLMIHRKKEHEENLEKCRLYQKGNCTYEEKCCFSHKNWSKNTLRYITKGDKTKNYNHEILVK